jgi:hypothetical protein
MTLRISIQFKKIKIHSLSTKKTNKLCCNSNSDDAENDNEISFAFQNRAIHLLLAAAVTRLVM